MFRWLLHLSIILVVTALVANYYANNGAGYGVTIPPYVYYGVLGLVTVVPVFWAITHLCGGLLMGIASGGVLDGLRLGLVLGLGMALSKLWPSALGAAFGIWLGQGPMLYAYLAGAVAVLLFGLEKTLHYFWRTTTSDMAA